MVHALQNNSMIFGHRFDNAHFFCLYIFESFTFPDH